MGAVLGQILGCRSVGKECSGGQFVKKYIKLLAVSGAVLSAILWVAIVSYACIVSQSLPGRIELLLYSGLLCLFVAGGAFIGGISGYVMETLVKYWKHPGSHLRN